MMNFFHYTKRNSTDEMHRTMRVTDMCIRETLTATTLTTFAPLLALFADTLFVGNIVGGDALCALSVTNPIITLCYVLLYILHMGGNVLASNKLGLQQENEARQYFTVSLLSTALLATVLFVVLMLLRGTICATWSPNEAIRRYASDYAGIIFLNLIPLSIASTLNYFVSGEGNPRFTSRAVLIGAAVNIVLDPIFIGLFHWGVKGAAIATLISSCTNAAIQIGFILSGKSVYKLVSVKSRLMRTLRENIVYGIGFNIINICTNLFMILANIVVAKTVTSDMFLGWGVCVQIQYFLYSFCLGTTVGSVFLGSSFSGEGDWKGVRRVARRVLEFQILFFGGVSILMWAIPAPIAWIFGIRDLALGATFRFVFGSFSIYLLCYCFICAYTNIFYMTQHVWMKIIIIILFSACVISCFWIGSTISANALWISMMIGSFLPVAATIFYVWTRHLKDPTLTHFTMLPSWPTDPQIDLTSLCDGQDRETALKKIYNFLAVSELNEEKLNNAFKAIQAMFDLALISVKYNRKGDVFDLRLVDQGRYVKLFIKVYGKPLQSVAQSLKSSENDCEQQDIAVAKERQNLVLSAVDESEYRYTYGMNETILRWDK